MNEDYPFKPDMKVKRYVIKITAFENAVGTEMEFFSDYRPTYHEVIGLLEAAKFRWLHEHRKVVLEADKKPTSEPNDEVSDTTKMP